MTDGNGTGTAPLVDRIKNILVTPKSEWPRIEAEPATVKGIFTGWVLILAAIPALAMLVGSIVFGYRALGFTYRPPIGEAIGSALVQYILAVAGIFVLALIIEALAPNFGATKSRIQAVKLAAYSMTAAWLAGAAGLLSFLGAGLIGLIGIIGGLYSLYLLYLGLPLLMKSPADKTIPYLATVIVAAIILYFVMGLLTSALAGSFMTRPGVSFAGGGAGTVSLPGGSELDLGKMEAASKQLEASARQMQEGAAAPAIAPDRLQALLPVSLGAYKRVELSSASAGAAGMGGSSADARYENGESSFELHLVDLSAAGAFAALGGALNVQQSRQTETGYERTSTVDGRIVNEKWDNGGNRGSYGVIVGNRFSIEASGKVPSIETLRGAVNAIGLDRLESLKG